jgi:hypothetical protein
MNKKPSNRLVRPAQAQSSTLPNMSDPCALLADAQQKYYQLMTGGATQSIETPLLGRVEFTPANLDQLARYIDALKQQCAQATGQPTLTRRPISFETLY